ncbi:MAG: M20/M25/M40 family metallo-hydrolase [Deltaproteobacteria bacterium]|nr:M20/M25/M40 family metallo-hydrolase [Deltaproteobacteria bacterium]
MSRSLLLAAGLPALLLAPAPAAPFEPSEVEAAAAVARAVEPTVRWLATQDFLIDELDPIADGLMSGLEGRAAFLQQFTNPEEFGELVLANVVALIPGGDLAGEYVVVGGHYDHLSPADCRSLDGDDLCNGAADNASGTAAVLAIARAIAALPAPPRRSIVVALWDAEEAWLIGSKWFTDHPPIPLANVSAYVNLDLIGSNLAPSVRRTSFAVGAESGGALLEQMTADAIAAGDLGIRPLSQIFGQGRSDYAYFLSAHVPIVYFGDSTNACYHSGADEVDVVDFRKLADQAEVAFRLVLALAESEARPTFVPWAPPYLELDYYEDLVVVSELLTGALADLEHFAEEERDDLIALEELARERVALGPEAYELGWAAEIGSTAVDLAYRGLPCDPELLPEPGATAGAAALATIALLGRRRRSRSRAQLRQAARMPRPARLLLAALAALPLPACRITPDEIQRIETENDLLREQIQAMRLECEQYRKIDIGVEKPASPAPAPSPAAAPETPAAETPAPQTPAP